MAMLNVPHGRNWRESTKADSLAHAKDFAEDWYLELIGKSRRRSTQTGKTFKLAAERFRTNTKPSLQVNAIRNNVAGHWLRLDVHLLPFLGEKVVFRNNTGLVQNIEFIAPRPASNKKTAQPIAKHSTIHQWTLAALKAAAAQIG